MNGSDLYQLVTSIMGYAPDQTLFQTLLNLVQGIRENQRPWTILKKEDTSNTVSASNTSQFLVPINMPADFRKFYSPKRSLQLSDPSNTIFQWYTQVTMDRKLENKDDNTKFYVNYSTNPITFFLCGTLNQTYTVHLFYIYRSPLITASTAWVFPSEYHAILAYDIAALIKLGIDSDVVNAEQAISNNSTSKVIFDQMAEWDDELAVNAIEGNSYFSIDREDTFISRTIPGTNNGQ